MFSLSYKILVFYSIKILFIYTNNLHFIITHYNEMSNNRTLQNIFQNKNQSTEKPPQSPQQVERIDKTINAKVVYLPIEVNSIDPVQSNLSGTKLAKHLVNCLLMHSVLRWSSSNTKTGVLQRSWEPDSRFRFRPLHSNDLEHYASPSHSGVCECNCARTTCINALALVIAILNKWWMTQICLEWFHTFAMT